MTRWKWGVTPPRPFRGVHSYKPWVAQGESPSADHHPVVAAPKLDDRFQ